MGKLVQFEKREGGREDGKSQGQQGAEILIFTGVRYERASSPDAPTKPTASGTKRKRG